MHMFIYNKALKKKVHYCGDGFKGIVKKRRTSHIFKVIFLEFCEFCGKERIIK